MLIPFKRKKKITEKARKKPTLKESKIEGDYCNWLRNDFPLLATALKLVLFVGRGFPDRTILCSGQVFFIEFKRPGGKLSAPQKLWRKRLTRLGFKYYVCYSTEEAQRVTKRKFRHLASA